MDEDLRNYLQDIKSSIIDVKAELKTFGVQLSNSIERLVKVETLMESQKEDMKAHEEREQTFGKSQADRISDVEKQVQSINVKIASWSGGIGVIIWLADKYL